MTSRPFANTQLAQFIGKRVSQLAPKKSQGEIASAAGFQNVNMLSMLKNGVSKLPIDRVPSLARALECDPAYLLRLALEQTWGSTIANAIIEIMGTPVTENERGWLQEIRDCSKNSDPRLTSRSRTALRAVFGK